jgi:hypothetical protein
LLLDRLGQRVGGPRTLATLSKYRDWPSRGVYFFFEPLEFRADSGTGPRVVRIGSHALNPRSRSSLRQRLGQHRGSLGGGGNHRGSIFRLLVGQALLARGGLPDTPSWGVKPTAAAAAAVLAIERNTLLGAELPVERAVSAHIATLPFLWLAVDDDPRSHSRRGFIESNAISLLSNYGRRVLDPPSSAWLGLASDRVLVSGSGLWHQPHVDETYDPAFLSILESVISD